MHASDIARLAAPLAVMPLRSARGGGGAAAKP